VEDAQSITHRRQVLQAIAVDIADEGVP